MTKIFKQLARHWAVCLVVFALLFVQAYCDLALPDYKRDGDISIEQQALAGIGVRDVGELMLGNAELLCQNCTVALRLRQQHHEIRVVQNVLNLPAGQQVVG